MKFTIVSQGQKFVVTAETEKEAVAKVRSFESSTRAKSLGAGILHGPPEERQSRTIGGQASSGAGISATVPRNVAKALTPKTIEDFRPAAEGAGAIVGGLAGLSAGGLGGFAGASLGAGFGGGAGFDVAKELGRATGLVGPRGIIADAPSPTPFSGGGGTQFASLGRTVDAAFFETMFPGMAGLAKGAIKRSAAGLINVGSAATERIMSAADRMGIRVGTETATQSGALRSTRRVVGKWPILSVPFKRSDRRIAGELGVSADQMLHDLAPVATTATKTGADLSAAQLKKQGKTRKHFNKLYEKIYGKATEDGVEIPTKSIVQRARDIVEEFDTRRPLKRPSKPGGKPEPIKETTDTSVIDFARTELSNLTETMTPEQYRGLIRQLNGMIDEAADTPHLERQAVILKEAVKEDLANAVGGTLSADIAKANEAFESWATLLASPTGQRFGRTAEGIFDVNTRKGTRNADVMFRSIFDAQSPTAIKELRELVGRKAYRKAVRQHVQKAFDAAAESSSDGVFLNLSKIKSQLGLGRPGSPERETLKAALDAAGTNVKIQDLDDFFRVASAHFDLGVINVSDFIARRAVLGGAKSAARTLVPGVQIAGAGAGAGAVAQSMSAGTVVAMIVAMGKAASLFTDPVVIKNAIRALDDTTPTKLKRESTARFLRLAGEIIARPEPLPTTPELFEQEPQPLGILGSRRAQ